MIRPAPTCAGTYCFRTVPKGIYLPSALRGGNRKLSPPPLSLLAGTCVLGHSEVTAHHAWLPCRASTKTSAAGSLFTATSRRTSTRHAFHAIYGDDEASYDFRKLKVTSGKLPGSQAGPS
jgi:hypothetical protein